MRRAPRWRAGLSWLFLLLFCLAAPLALLAGWAKQMSSDPEAYASAARAVAGDPRVQHGLSGAVTHQAQALLAGENPTATKAVQSRVLAQALGNAAGEVMAGDEFLAVWEEANREVHAFLFSEVSAGWGEPVVLDLSPLTDELQAEVDALDVDIPDEMRFGPEDLRFEVLNDQNADQVRRAVRQVNRVFWGALAVTAIALVLTIALAPDRLAALGRVAFGLAIGMMALIVLMLAAQGAARTAAGANGSGAALGAMTDAISQGLRLSAIALALAGLLLAGLCSGLAALRRGTARRAALG